VALSSVRVFVVYRKTEEVGAWRRRLGFQKVLDTGGALIDDRKGLLSFAARGGRGAGKSRPPRIWGLGAAVDVVRLASSDFDARGAHVAASLPSIILREGRLLYDARRVAA
jgi:hypothetical protein